MSCNVLLKDYTHHNRGLIEVTRRDANPLPRVDDTLDDLKGANFYTHLDLASGFRRVRVRDEDVHKILTGRPPLRHLADRWNGSPCHSARVMHMLHFS
jgi:hypothetical protein